MINAIKYLPCKTAGCPVMGDYALKKKMTVPYSKARKGDVVLYDFNHNGTSDHTGIIYDVKGGNIYVVEGNTGSDDDCNGGQVQKRVRNKSVVNYIIRPKYDKTVTADMVVRTALSQVGIKESPKNSNNVMYNTWYYGHAVRGSNYAWCCTFVCWCFAHVQNEKSVSENTVAKKTVSKNTYAGSMPSKTVRKGNKNADVTKWQKWLNWAGFACGRADGDFGPATEKATKAAQKAFGFKGRDIDGIAGPKTISAAKKYVKKNVNNPSQKPAQTTPQKAQNVDIRGLKKVIDISYWQAVADLQKAKKDGVDGVIIRTSYTSKKSFALNKDSRFKMHIENAIKAGLPIGVYHYSQAISEAEARKEAAYILDIIKPYKSHINLPVIFDWEFGGRLSSATAKKLGRSGCDKVITAFCNDVIAAGYTAMVYANYHTFKDYVNYKILRGRFLIWLAQYASKPSLTDYDLWQYTSSGKVAGVSGNVDMNRGRP